MEIDKEKCRIIGSYLKGLDIRDHVTRIHGKDLDGKLFFALIFVGICHAINYDFLSRALARIQKEQPERFNPKYMERISNQELYNWLKGYPKKWRLEIETRADFVRDICKKLNDKFRGSALKLFKKTGFSIPEIYRELDIFKAFREDPLRKKTSCLIGEIYQNKLAELTGWESFKPTIDYHISRTILRNGLVRFPDKKVMNDLIEFCSANEKRATLVRSRCMEAVIEVARRAGKCVDDVRLLYWYVGRDCCNESNPSCERCDNKGCSLPDCLSRKKCILSEVCESARNENLRRIREPNFKTTFY